MRVPQLHSFPEAQSSKGNSQNIGKLFTKHFTKVAAVPSSTCRDANPFSDRCHKAREADAVEPQGKELPLYVVALPRQRLQRPAAVPGRLRQVRQLLEGPRLRPRLRPRDGVQREVAAVRLPRQGRLQGDSLKYAATAAPTPAAATTTFLSSYFHPEAISANPTSWSFLWYAKNCDCLNVVPHKS